MRSERKKYLNVLFGKSAAYKSKYTLTPLLSQNILYFTPITNLMTTFEVWYYFTSSTSLFKKLVYNIKTEQVIFFNQSKSNTFVFPLSLVIKIRYWLSHPPACHTKCEVSCPPLLLCQNKSEIRWLPPTLVADVISECPTLGPRALTPNQLPRHQKRPIIKKLNTSVREGK